MLHQSDIIDVFKAWINGESIQTRPKQGKDQKWSDTHRPAWFPECEYRVKPKIVKVKLQFYGYFRKDLNSYFTTTNELNLRHPMYSNHIYVRCPKLDHVKTITIEP